VKSQEGLRQFKSPRPDHFLPQAKSSTDNSQVIHNFSAGENFVAWTKENRNSLALNCSKKFILRKPAAKPALYDGSSDNYSGWHRRC
jgi:hypothetical protein